MDRNCSQSCPASRAAPALTPRREQRRGSKLIFFRETKGAQQNEKIGFILAAEEILALVAHLPALRAPEQIAPLGKGGDERNPTDATLFLGREQHARITRMNRKGEHALA